MSLAERKPLVQLLRHPPRYGINAAAVPQTPGIPTYIRITDIDDTGRFAPDPKVGVDHPRSSDYQLTDGDLVFARTGASVGKSYLYNPRDGALVYAGFLINVAPDRQQLNPKFLSIFVRTKEYWDWIARTSVRSGQPGVNGREFAQLPVPVPDIATQDAIARVITDVDDLLGTLDRLIAKKQATKQGMMQQLLTGKTRLPGFMAPWRDRCAINEVCDRSSGFWGTEDPTPSATIAVQVIRAGDITPDGQLAGWADRFFSASENKRAACRVDDVIITASGNGLGKTYYVKRPERLAASNFVRILRPREGVSGEFISYLMRSSMAQAQLEAHTATSAYPNLMASFFVHQWFSLPAFDEQVRIAEALRSVDDELDGLRDRAAKARCVKEGMVQELLTGRTRLPVVEVVA